MLSKKNSAKAAPAAKDFDDLDNYFDDLDEDPFASPKPAEKSNAISKKRTEPGDVLGIDEEVAVAKKARIPRIKLDEDRLLSDKGIPELRKRARNLQLKGKGHEFDDAARLLSFYQNWLDDLFPKAKFLDAVAMVEKAGHKKTMHKLRTDWINEGKPKSTEDDSYEPTEQADTSEPTEPARITPIFEEMASSRPKTPEVDDLFGGDEDLYRATPLAGRKDDNQTIGDTPDDEDLDALMAEAEADRGSSTARTNGAPITSIFGSGKPAMARNPPDGPDDDDDFEAFLAEAEVEQASKQNSHIVPKITAPAAHHEKDDLDALMAEEEARKAPPKILPKFPVAGPPVSNEEEEAMAEMEGLW